jgi:nicotinamidase-related amidase
MATRKRNVLVGIDWQTDFVSPTGALYVKDAEKSADRLAAFVKKHGNLFDDIALTMDSHQPLHIAHAAMWVDKNGDHPTPFTTILASDVEKKWWMTREPWKGYGKEYTSGLESSGRFKLMIWPDHCLIGTLGHNIFPSLMEVFYEWARKLGKTLGILTKGSNPFCEHYSAVRAERPFLGGNGYEPDPGTQTNLAWLNMLAQYDNVVFSEQALSHCGRFTNEDTIEQFGADAAKKIIIVRDFADCVVTPAYDFTPETEAWLDTVKKQGIRVMQSSELPSLLR